ncbi:MAG: hypothetical protein EHM41_03445 [Chloroflexi bacterium]|nr:MAG: hypothetical protein EHM41_03445 [Chloroflexota bacterium]
MNRAIEVLCIVISTTVLSAAYITGGYITAAMVIVFIGAGWLVAELYKWIPVTFLGLLFSSLAAGAGILLDLQIWLVFLGAAAGLAAWDLTRFNQHLQLAADTDDVRDLEKRHLGWLGGTLFIGLLLAGGSIVAQAQLPFGWIMIFAILGVLGLVRFVAWVSRS